MGDRTEIEWTDATINPVVGCRRISEGCRGCYAERLSATRLSATPRYLGLATSTPSGPRWTGEIRFVPEDLAKPLRWKRARRIFVCDMSDLFYERVSDEQIAAVFAMMAAAKQHTFQVLTKRSARARDWISRVFGMTVRDRTLYLAGAARVLAGLELADQIATVPFPLANVWIGASVERQKEADERISELARTPAAVRFLSCEPLLELVNLRLLTYQDAIERDGHGGVLTTRRKVVDWIIAGGESGPTARPMHPTWARSLRDQATVAGVAFFFKQWGAWQLGSTMGVRPEADRIVLVDGSVVRTPDEATNEQRLRWAELQPTYMAEVGKKMAGRTLDGVTHHEFPGSST
jgi:protein gp37